MESHCTLPSRGFNGKVGAFHHRLPGAARHGEPARRCAAVTLHFRLLEFPTVPPNYSYEIGLGIATARSVIQRFLRSKNPEVLALNGAWGVGKTYLWKQEVESCTKIAASSYCYISLFGLGSMRDLRAAILAKSLPTEQIGERSDETLRTDLADIGKRLSRWVARLQGRAGDLPVMKNLSVGIDFVAGFMTRDMIICFDDFERLSDGIRQQELLGFISELKEERNCKIALIFNDAKLQDEGKILNTYREKVVDMEVLFSPTTEEAAALAFNSSPNKDLLTKYAASLNITNIRILTKIRRYAEIIGAALTGLHDGVLQQALSTIVLMTWSCSDSGSAPTPNFIKKWYLGWGATRTRSNSPLSEQESAWSSVLQRYGLTHFDDFDSAILKAIACGYVEETGLVEAAQNVDTRIRAGEVESQFSAAWRLFHDSFDDNQNEFIVALDRGFRLAVRQISPASLSGAVDLLRELGQGELADQMIEFYVTERDSEDGLFDLSSYPWIDQVPDPTLAQRFDLRHARTHRVPTLKEAAERIALRNGWSNEEMQALLQASEEDLYQLFKQSPTVNLHKIVRGCLMFSQAPNEQIGERALAALRRISLESPLNAARVRRYSAQLAK